MERITVFTPTFNRANALYRVYESLEKQTYRDFRWLVVDDGSTDETKEIIEGFKEKADFNITYIYQENQGKHVAINTAVKVTESELFLIADSDDAFLENSLEIFINTWDQIPNKEEFKGVICRCFDSTSKEPIGIAFPEKVFDSNDLEAFFKHKLKFEKWNLFTTQSLREFPFPENTEGLKFFPETVIWQRMARKYKTRYIDVCLREYFRDQDNALTNCKTNRYKENVYLWEHYINSVYDYFWSDPLRFIKAFIGMGRDNILCGNKYTVTVKKINRFDKRLFFTLLYPVSVILSKVY